MGNTIRRDGSASDAQRARYDIIRGRKTARANRSELRAYDERAISARLAGGQA